MPFNLPSFSQVLADLVADFQNRFPSANVSKLSGHWKRLAVFAGGVALLDRHLQVVARDVMPDTAAGAQLDRHGSIYGVTRRAATSASKAGALRLTGTAASAFSVGVLLTTTDGLAFELNETGVLPGTGFRDVAVIAVSTGAATRKSAGTVMTFTSPPSGIDSTAVLQLDMDVDGSDLESDGAYRVRILDTIAQPGMGGNANDYRQWAKQLAGIDEAYVWPLRGGLGSVHLAALHTGTGAQRILSGAEITALKAYIDTVRPVGYADFAVLATTAAPTDVEIVVEPEDDPAYEFDWVDSVPLVVSTWTGATRTLVFTTPRPSDMLVGDRLVVKRITATVNDGHEYIIESLSSTNAVVLKDDAELATSPPVATNSVYSGGPLVAPVRAAILAHMNLLGPGRGDTLDATKDYSAGSSYWESTLRVSKVRTLAQKQKGVLDTDLLNPTFNILADNQAPALTAAFLSPRQVLVRRMW
jgi:uncharacterized phage protein gp47/JayE